MIKGGQVISQLAHRGDMAILLVEQFYDFAEQLADKYLLMSRGSIIQSGDGKIWRPRAFGDWLLSEVCDRATVALSRT